MRFLRFFIVLLLLPSLVHASSAVSDLTSSVSNLTESWVGPTALIIISIAYILVVLEEKINLRKSKPMLISAGLIWAIMAYVYGQEGHGDVIEKAVRHNFLEYSELFFSGFGKTGKMMVFMTHISKTV
jgi:hypothetical protein